MFARVGGRHSSLHFTSIYFGSFTDLDQQLIISDPDSTYQFMRYRTIGIFRPPGVIPTILIICLNILISPLGVKFLKIFFQKIVERILLKKPMLRKAILRQNLYFLKMFW